MDGMNGGPSMRDGRMAGSAPTEALANARRTASDYASLSAQEAFDAYAAWFGRTRAATIAIAVLLGAAAIYCAFRGWTAPYFALLALIIAVGVMQNVRIGRRFQGLEKILSEDCDAAKYRAVMERFAARWHRRSTQAVVNLELAFCAYSACDVDAALEHLSRARFRARSFQWIRWLDIQAVCLHEKGDASGRDRALVELRARRGHLRGAAAERADMLIRALEVSFVSHASWTPDAAAFMRDIVARAENHLNRVGACLLLAEYELLHGSRERALLWLDERLLVPMVPRAARARAELLRRLGVDGAENLSAGN